MPRVLGHSSLDAPRIFAAALLAALFWSGAPLLAQGAAPVPTTIETGETMYTLLVKGGWLMVPIALCSVVVLMFAIERAISLRRSRTTPDGLLASALERVHESARGRDVLAEIADEVEGSRTLLGAILGPGIRKTHLGRVVAEEFLAEAAAKQVALLKRRLRPFAVVETLAPLLGLLGTVYGMITCFENAASTDAASRSESLARGIYGALVTTAAGLSVAIPAKVLYHTFESRVDRIIDKLEADVNEFVESIFGEQDEPIVHRADHAPRRREDASAAALSPLGEDDSESDEVLESDEIRTKRKELIAQAMKRRSGT